MKSEDFIRKYYPYTRGAQAQGIFPAVSLAIAYLESNRKKGISELASKYNNFHGIQSYPNWKGRTVRLTDNLTGSTRTFCVYPNPAAGFQGFIDFLTRNPRYQNAGVFRARTPGEQIKRIAEAGYSETSTWAKAVSKTANLVPDEQPIIRLLDLISLCLVGYGIFISLPLLFPDWKLGQSGKY